MAASGISIVAISVLVLLQLAVGGNAASLEIFPNGDVQSKPIGSSLILTCQPNVSGEDVISDIRWLDPENRTIETRSSAAAAAGSNANPPMSTEMHQPNNLKLYIYSLKENQAGRYTCVAKYAATETLRKSVMIETIEAIKWIDAPENQYPILGKEFKIKCHVSARPSPTVDWLHDGNLITTNDHYIIETHALKINKVVESDEGIYTCRASVLMTGELEERAIRVEVLEEPKIEEIPTEIEIIEGKTETIPCKASGKPAPKYTWVKYLTREDLSKTDRFSVEPDTGMLAISNVNREDDGEYQCTAKNTAGEAQTIIKVAVIGKPKIMEFFNRTSPVGKTVELECKAFGRPSPEVYFRKQTSNHPFKHGIQPDDDRITMKSVQSTDARGETVAVLSIENLLRKDDGLYECVAKNKVETATKNGHLTVEFPPSFVSMNNRTVWSWERRPVNLTCIAESIPNATIQWYMNGERPVDLNDPMYQQIGKGPVSTLTVQPVDRRYYGIYKCRALNVHGTRENLIELREAERPGLVQQARMSEITATTIAFNVVPPATQPELQLRSISVQYKDNTQPWTNAKNKTWSVGSPYVIEGLKPLTQYDFRFSARNDVGDGNWGADLVETTPQRNIPNPPRIQVRSGEALYEISQFNNQYHLQWHAPPDNGEPIDLYEIRYCQVKRAGNDWELLEGSCVANEMKGQRTKQWLKDLNSDSFYRAEVRAHNVIGFSNPGVVHFKTARGENMPLVHKGQLISSAAIIGIVIAALVIVIVIIDVICCCTHKTGIIYYVCERSRKKPVDDEATKLGSLYGWRFPLPYCDQKMANVAGVTAVQDSGNGKNTIKLVKHTAIEEKEPLKEEKKITPIIDSGLRRETSITFDGKRSVSKTGFVGKDSAV